MRSNEFIHMGRTNSITSINFLLSADELNANASGYANKKQNTVVSMATRKDLPITAIMLGLRKKCAKFSPVIPPVAPSVNA